jgi:ubiquinone/menaquinone biosynthesis C-methylase UbiE
LTDLEELFQPGRRAPVGAKRGYVDLLGEDDPTGRGPGQRLMESRVLPTIYERIWRPLGARLLTGLTGPGTEEEHRIVLEALALTPGDRVLDVACGPGNFTRDFAAAVGDGGLAVGLDASATMLEVAVRETAQRNVVYLRGDAADLPFRDGSFDAVCCFAALYLIEEPWRALEEIARVLAPEGRVALLSSCARGPLPAGAIDGVVRRVSGVRVFGRDELTEALAAEGVEQIEQRVIGFAQFVAGRKAAFPSGAG